MFDLFGEMGRRTIQDEVRRLDAIEVRVKRERASAAREARVALLEEIAKRGECRVKVGSDVYLVSAVKRTS